MTTYEDRRTRPSAAPPRYGFQNFVGSRCMARSSDEEEDVGLRAGLGLHHLVPARGDEARDVAPRIGEVAERERARRADLAARGRPALRGPVQAEGALVDVARRVDVPRAVGARGDAGLAAGALRAVHEDDAAVGDVRGAGRAGRDARRVRALVAPLGADLHREIGELPPDLLDDPVAEPALGERVLGLAGDDARV